MAADLTVLCGNYGSGKTELALSITQQIAERGEKACLIDLDFVKPYFRSREMCDSLLKSGVKLVSPRGVLAGADLPVILPEVRPLLAGQGHVGRIVVDLGGDPGGARAIAQFAPILQVRTHELLLVVNTLRPFASTVERILQALEQLSAVTRLSISALVANTNLGASTRPEFVESGYAITAEAAQRAGLPIRAVVAPDFLKEKLDQNRFREPLVLIHRQIRPPWEQIEIID